MSPKPDRLKHAVERPAKATWMGKNRAKNLRLQSTSAFMVQFCSDVFSVSRPQTVVIQTGVSLGLIRIIEYCTSNFPTLRLLVTLSSAM